MRYEKSLATLLNTIISNGILNNVKTIKMVLTYLHFNKSPMAKTDPITPNRVKLPLFNEKFSFIIC